RIARRATALGCVAHRQRFDLGVGKGKANHEPVTLAFAFALRGDGAALQLDQVQDDVEAEAQPTSGSRERAVGLPESIESVRQELRADPDAIVRDDDLRLAIDAAD